MPRLPRDRQIRGRRLVGDRPPESARDLVADRAGPQIECRARFSFHQHGERVVARVRLQVLQRGHGLAVPEDDLRFRRSGEVKRQRPGRVRMIGRAVPAIAVLEAVVRRHLLRSRGLQPRLVDAAGPFRRGVAPRPVGQRRKGGRSGGRLRDGGLTRVGVDRRTAARGREFHAAILEYERRSDVEFPVGKPRLFRERLVHDEEARLVAVAGIEVDFLDCLIGGIIKGGRLRARAVLALERDLARVARLAVAYPAIGRAERVLQHHVGAD